LIRIAKNLSALNIDAKEAAIPIRIHFAGCQVKDRLCRVRVAGGELQALELEKKDPHDEAGAFDPIDKRVIFDDACRAFAWQHHGVGGDGRQVTRRAPEGRMQKRFVMQPFCPACSANCRSWIAGTKSESIQIGSVIC
jgi:hypothetical protein